MSTLHPARSREPLQSVASLAQVKAGSPPRYSQAEIDGFVAAHERFVLGKPQGGRAIMRFLQAPDIDFCNRNLADADFTGANLRGARLIFTVLERASLFCADLYSANARGANLRRADLRGVSLRHADLSCAMLDQADMRQAVLARVDTTKGFRLVGRAAESLDGDQAQAFSVDLSNASMKGVDLRGAKLKHANFDGALLEGAQFRGADIGGSRFNGAVLTGVKVGEMRLGPGAMVGAVFDPSSAAMAAAAGLLQVLDQAQAWVASNGRAGRAGVFNGHDLRPLGLAFEGALLTAVSARAVCAVGVSFARAQLQGANFDEADLRDADFRDADLRGASFRGARLWHARFGGADLTPLHLASGGRRRVDLTGAQVSTEILARTLHS